MKNIFLISFLIMGFNVEADDTVAAKKTKTCNKAELEKAVDLSVKGVYPGSANFYSCDEMSRGKLKDLYKNGARNSSILPDWQPYLKYACKEKCDDIDGAFEKCVKDKEELAKKCESVVYVMSFYERDWNDSEQIQPVSGKTSGDGAPASAAGPTFKCKSEGIETLDYIPCKKFVSQINILDALQIAAQGAQELIYADKMMDANAKYAKEENSATGALKATGESLEKQQGMYQQRTAIDATKLAYMYSLYKDMPKMEEMRDKCQGIERVTSEIGLGPPVNKDDCRSHVLSGKGFALAQNQSQLDAMKSKLITIATSAGSNAILSALLGKRAGDVKNAIAQIDEFKPIDPVMMAEEDTLTTFCQLNPSAEKCLTQDLSRTFDTLNDNIITFGEGGTGTNYGATEGVNANAITSTGGDPAGRTSVSNVGSIIASAAKNNSIEDSNAATVTAGKAPSGGGGGGGSGGGGSGGGGGGSNIAPPAQGSVAAAIQGKTPSYAGGGGSISVVGGLGLNRAKGDGKTEDNPFGKLFGKDKPKDSGVLNFRGIASQKVGDKAENLFDMISKRYSTVAADKRLIEYELVK